MIWVNFKIYKETFGDGALFLAEACYRAAQKSGIKIIPIVSPFDLVAIKEKFQKEVWLQHGDVFFEGAKTGWLSPLQAILKGADGFLLNHSEHKLPPGKISQILAYLKRKSWQKKWEALVGKKLPWDKVATMVCFRSQGQARKWVRRLDADWIAYEPPELIGGDVSVSKAQPGVIQRIVSILPKKKIVVGAGIKNVEDVKMAVKLGAKGILVSSAVVKSSRPEKVLLQLAEGFLEK